MERQTGSWFISYMKVATATAILKTKPKGMTGQQYAEVLCNMYQTAQLDWKRRAEGLQQEVLRLKQQAIQTHLSQREEGGQVASQTSLSEDVPDSQPLLPTPPCSSEEHQHHDDNESDANRSPARPQSSLTPHTQFLKSVLCLSSVTNAFAIVGFSDTMGETVESSLHLIVNEIISSADGGGRLSETSVQHCVDTIRKLVDQRQSLSPVVIKGITDVVLKMVQHIIAAVITNEKLGCHRSQQRLCQVLQQLSMSSNLRAGVTSLLVQCIEECSNMLRQFKFRQVQLKPHTFENVIYIFRCLQEIFENESLRTDSERRLGTEVAGQIKAQLDNSLLHITEDFPAFAHYVWQLGALCEGLGI